MENPYNQKTIIREGSQSAFNEGLRKYMLQVYNYMGLGLAMTGLVAYIIATSPALQAMVMPFWILFALAPLGIVLYISFRANSLSAASAQGWFWAYAILNGVTFSAIFLVYEMPSVARVFFITAGTFFAMSLYGYTTRKDLTSWGSFLFMGLIGVIIAMVVNLFLESTMLNLLISLVGVGVFVGLTAYDTQKIKESYSESASTEATKKGAVYGALTLYLDFINLFLMLLRLLGDRR